MKRDALRGRVFITGFHGMGVVGHLTVRHLVLSMRSRLVGYLATRHMPQYSSAREGGIATPYEFYLVEDKAVVFVSHLPLSSGDIGTLPYLLADISMRGGAKMALLVGGLDKNFKRGESTYRYAATSEFLERYPGMFEGSHQLEEGLYIVGPLAAMMNYYQLKNYPNISFSKNMGRAHS